jgi:hypothetical protein
VVISTPLYDLSFIGSRHSIMNLLPKAVSVRECFEFYPFRYIAKVAKVVLLYWVVLFLQFRPDEKYSPLCTTNEEPESIIRFFEFIRPLKVIQLGE